MVLPTTWNGDGLVLQVANCSVVAVVVEPLVLSKHWRPLPPAVGKRMLTLLAGLTAWAAKVTVLEPAVLLKAMVPLAPPALLVPRTIWLLEVSTANSDLLLVFCTWKAEVLIELSANSALPLAVKLLPVPTVVLAASDTPPALCRVVVPPMVEPMLMLVVDEAVPLLPMLMVWVTAPVTLPIWTVLAMPVLPK